MPSAKCQIQAENGVRISAKRVARAWIPALVWLAVIALESTSLGSSAHTQTLLLAILRFLNPQINSAQLELANEVARKVGHCFGYATLSLLMLRAWWTTLMLPRSATRIPPWKAMVTSWSARAAAIALASTALVASLDEWHQLSIPGRTGTIHDVALDSMAAACVQLLVIAFSDVKRKQLAISD
jgi:VanZ family protein